MTKEQKEGFVIATVSMIALITLALLTSWKGEFSDAALYFNGFEKSCSYKPPVNPSDIFGSCLSGIEYVWGFSVKFRTILIFFLPVISYGVLRSFGIVKRLFKFEEKLFKFIE